MAFSQNMLKSLKEHFHPVTSWFIRGLTQWFAILKFRYERDCYLRAFPQTRSQLTMTPINYHVSIYHSLMAAPACLWGHWDWSRDDLKEEQSRKRRTRKMWAFTTITVRADSTRPVKQAWAYKMCEMWETVNSAGPLDPSNIALSLSLM